MKTQLTRLILSVLPGLIAMPVMHAANAMPVTVDNFARAESDLYMGSETMMPSAGRSATGVSRR